MKVENISLEVLIPYARNSRTHSDQQVAQVAASIREFGFTNPVLIGKENDIIAGHGRVLAARKLGLENVPCIRLGHLTETQKRAYVIADNQLALNAGWDESLLAIELATLREENFDLGLVGFDADEIEAVLNPPEPEIGLSEKYTQKVETPVYEPKGEKPLVSTLVDKSKCDLLVQKIKQAKIPAEISDFLVTAAQRHTVFNFEKIAEFYCHADKSVQNLMEESALVIIDFKKALQLGYVKLREEIAETMNAEPEDTFLNEE